LHGGTVKARSEGIGHGSEFTVTLPLMKSQTRPELESPKKAPRSTRPIRVLCVDDRKELADNLASLVNTMGHEAQVAYDAVAALRMAQTFRPEMVLLDIDMLDVDGYELAARLRDEQRDSPPMLVALTGWGRHGEKQRAENAGFQRYLVKPVTTAALEGLLPAYAPDTNGSPSSASS
jgi:CheY-like chemotaxis protein